MSEEKCCCNCLHCARWRTKSGIECHCDLTDRFLSYLDVMDADNNCKRWEKETKWDLQDAHDAEIRVDERKKFAEWLNEQHHFIKSVDELLAEYEKQMKGSAE